MASGKANFHHNNLNKRTCDVIESLNVPFSGEHCHDKENKEKGLDKRARRKLVIASVLCLAFMIGEVVG